MQSTPQIDPDGTRVALPKPRIPAGDSLERALSQRRSRRTFTDDPVTVADLAQMLWAAQGITGAYDLRAAPSAGGLYPLRLYAVAGNVTGLAPGAYRYRPSSHDLQHLADGDLRPGLREATGYQECLGTGAVDIVIAAEPAGILGKYGERGMRYLHMEAGHAAQNLCLQATVLGLAITTVCAFDDVAMACASHLGDGETPLYAMPVGHSAGPSRP